jgi:hypothetical protein
MGLVGGEFVGGARGPLMVSTTFLLFAKRFVVDWRGGELNIGSVDGGRIDFAVVVASKRCWIKIWGQTVEGRHWSLARKELPL